MIRAIETTSRSTLMTQGPHLMQLVTGYLGNAQPRRVFAQIAGTTLLGAELREPTPDQTLAWIEYDNDVGVTMVLGDRIGPRVSEHPSHFHQKHITVHGERGFVRWTMYRAELVTTSTTRQTTHDYLQEEGPAQLRLTEAMFDWIADEKNVPAVSLASALREFNVLLAIYVSALERRPIDLPIDPPTGLLDRLRAALQ